ncbi:hypothetical protein KAR91_84135 [Candidatus Pacearchaeota archaeon]|nr:hypothetical protein [Candidatus Pacearchaeota archaeon]
MRRLVFIFVLLLVGSVFGADIEVQEVASGDDADSSNTGWSITGDPLLLGDNGEAAAWRFLNIAIPQGATIDSAWIMFQACDGNTNDSARVNFY